LAIENNEKIIAYPLKGEFIDIGGWEYLKDLKKYFDDLSFDNIDKLISQRASIMEKLRSDFKDSESTLNAQKNQKNK